MAHTDLLTGVANRRALHELLEREMARAERTGAPLALAMVDVDDFKGFNDRHGHELGDEVLREVARRLHASVRRTDAVGRWGGEEFLVVLADTYAEGGRIAAEGLRSRITDLPLAINGDHHSLTVSVGVAQHRPGTELDRLLRDADDALYRAKAAGKNRVELAA